MKKLVFLALLASLAMVTSCKKENSITNSNSSLDGTYTFKYMTAYTTSTITGSLGDSTITDSHYTTTQNGGTIVFSNATMTISGLTYTIDTIAKYYLYNSSTLIDSSSFPFTYTVPSFSGSYQYKVVGTDSIYIPQASLGAGISASGVYQSGGGGAHYKLNGNLLTIIQNISTDSTFTTSGETFDMLNEGSESIVLQKQ